MSGFMLARVNALLFALALLSVTSTAQIAAPVNPEWKRFQLGESRISILLPNEPTAKPMELSPEASRNIKSEGRWSAVMPDLAITAGVVQYQTGYMASLRIAEDAFLRVLRADKTISGVTFKSESARLQGRLARVLRGSYKRDQADMRFVGAFVVEGDRLVRIQVDYRATLNNGPELADSAINSIEFNDAGAPEAVLQKIVVGTTGLSIDFFGDLVRTPLNLDPVQARQYRASELFRGSDRSTTLSITYWLFQDRLSGNIDESTKFYSANLRQSRGVSELEMRTVPFRVGDVEGTLTESKFVTDSGVATRKELVIADKERFWRIELQTYAQDAATLNALQKIIQSVSVAKIGAVPPPVLRS